MLTMSQNRRRHWSMLVVCTPCTFGLHMASFCPSAPMPRASKQGPWLFSAATVTSIRTSTFCAAGFLLASSGAMHAPSAEQCRSAECVPALRTPRSHAAQAEAGGCAFLMCGGASTSAHTSAPSYCCPQGADRHQVCDMLPCCAGTKLQACLRCGGTPTSAPTSAPMRCSSRAARRRQNSCKQRSHAA